MGVGRNDPCPCGSGRKYKQCCGQQGEARGSAPPAQLRGVARLVQLLNSGQAAAAETQAQSALQREPQSGILWKVLSVAQLRQGKDALPALRRAAQLLPADAEAHANLATGLRARGDWQGALEALSVAIRLQPGNADALMAAGDAQLALGRPTEAITLYQGCLKADPRRTEAYNNMGNALLRLGHAREAVRCYGKALEITPDAPFVICNLADALRRTGEADAALTAARQAVALAPQLAAAHNVLGVVLAARGERAAAAQSLQAALQHDPNLIDAYTNLAGVLRDAGDPEQALAVSERAVQLAPGRADAHCNLGLALFGLKRPGAAAASFSQALALAPRYPAALIGLAAAERLLGRTALAREHVEAALQLEPRNPEALVLLGEVQADLGRFAESEALFRRAIEADPDFAPAYSAHASHRRMQKEDAQWLAGVERLLARALPPEQEVPLRTALGKFHDDTGDYDRAFESYRAANELSRRHRPPYNSAGLSALVARLEALCTRQFVQEPQPGAADSQRPVFIIGMPRSGTSLAEQILAAHPQVHGAGEVRYWDRAFARFEQAPAAARPPAQIAQEYLARIGEHAGPALRITDKLPANFLYAGFIRAVLPHARFIHMQRHPLDTCVSIYFQSFFNVGSYASDLDALAHYYREYRRIMAYWRTVLPPGALLEVPYEGLVENGEHWIRRVVEFAGVPWDPAVLEFHRSERVVVTASRWQVRQQLNSGSLGRWRRYERHLGPLLSLLEEPGAPAQP